MCYPSNCCIIRNHVIALGSMGAKVEYDLTPKPKRTLKPMPPLAKQLIGIDTDECTVDLDENSMIAEDVVCRHCKYNLRGLDIQSRCPECGISIAWSTHGDFLRYSDPAWVKELSNGTLWMISAILVGIAAFLFASSIVGGTGKVIIQLIGSGIGLVGYWKLTTPDPGYPELNPIWNIRQMTRILAVLGFLGMALKLTTSLTFSSNDAIFIASSAFSIALMLMGSIAALLLFVLIRGFANRIPDHDLANQTTVVMWGTICSYAVILIGALLALLSYASGSGDMLSVGVFGIFGCAGLIGIVIFWIWWIVLLFKYRTALDAAVDVALKSWMRHAAQSYSYS